MIYKFRILSDEDENFIREIEIDQEQTFLDLHNIIQEVTNYDNSQMASFYVIGANGLREKEVSLIEMNTEEDDNMNVVTMDVTMIRELISKENPSLIYVFDFFSDRFFKVELAGTYKPSGNIEYPHCCKAKGKAPGQIKIDAESLTVSEPEDADMVQDESNYDFLEEFDNIGDDNGAKFENLDDYEDMI